MFGSEYAAAPKAVKGPLTAEDKGALGLGRKNGWRNREDEKTGGRMDKEWRGGREEMWQVEGT